jgi:hypothetical protein
MHRDRFDTVTEAVGGRSSRRHTLGVTLGGVFAALPLRESAAKKKKKKKCPPGTTCPPCPRPPICPIAPPCPPSCTLIYHEVSNQTLCGVGNGLQTPCKQCSSSAECTTFPHLHCVRNTRRVSDGAVLGFEGGCGGPYPAGVCVSVLACPT